MPADADLIRRVAALEDELLALWLVIRIAAQRSVNAEAVDWGDVVATARRSYQGGKAGHEALENMTISIDDAPRL